MKLWRRRPPLQPGGPVGPSTPPEDITGDFIRPAPPPPPSGIPAPCCCHAGKMVTIRVTPCVKDRIDLLLKQRGIKLNASQSCAGMIDYLSTRHVCGKYL